MSPQYIGSEEFAARGAALPRPAMPVPWLATLLQLFALGLSLTMGAPAVGAPALVTDPAAAPHALPALAQPDAAAEDDEDDDDAGDYPDDGSGALGNGSGFPVPDGLLPITPAEEKGLLGNWGDSAAEAED